MTFEEVLDQAIAMLQRRGRVTYRTLQRQFQLDDEVLEDLKVELIEGQRLATDERGTVLVWTSDAEAAPAPARAPGPQGPVGGGQASPIVYTPRHLAERILAEQAALEAHGAPDGERKTITALFADIKGSMQLLEDLDPEEARQIIDPALQVMMAAVHRYEGYVAQSLGDGIFALFGAPIAHEDHAQRALYAALRMQEAITRVLLRESLNQPLLLLIEDLHWLDSETEAWGQQLSERVPTAPILLLVNYRPEYQHGWGSKTYYTQLRLDPLPEASAEELLQALLGEDASLVPLTQLLIARTQGNPFFLEESVRTLVETGVLVGDRGTYRLVKPLDVLQVPATVQALLAARIDRLPPEDKRLLQTAAVIGTEVPWPLLQAIADTSDEALYRSLTQLQAAEFLYETGLFPERAYTFKHALTHEVAYGSLLHERRRALHARIVEVLEAMAGDRLDDQVERLAQHALRGEVWEKALAYGHQAGDKARTRSAYREAVVCYEQALAALEHVPDSRAATAQAIDVRLGLHGALNALREAPGRMLDHLRRAETLAETLGDQRRLGQVYAVMSLNFWVAGDVDRAIATNQRALAVATTLGDVGLQARTHLSLGRIYYDTGDYARAVESLERNVAMLQGDLLYEHFGSNNIVAAASRAWLSNCHAERGAFTEGLAMAEEGLQIAETGNRPFSQIEACLGVSMVYLRQGEVQRAIPVLERAMGLCQDWHIPLFVPWLAAALGVAYVLEGRVATGLALVEEGVEQEVAMHRSRRLALMVACLSEVYLLAGRLEDARQRAEQALDLARQYQQCGNQAWALWLLGESTARQASPEVEPAAGHYRQALALAEELGMRPLQAHCHRGLGTLYARQGQQEQARTALSTAIALYALWTCDSGYHRQRQP